VAKLKQNWTQTQVGVFIEQEPHTCGCGTLPRRVRRFNR
jgi:hypothetical protein